MDFSDYPVEHPNYDKTNKKVLGKFKDEMNGKIITKFIGLKLNHTVIRFMVKIKTTRKVKV